MPIGFPAYDTLTKRFKGVTRQDLARATGDALDDLGWSWRRPDRWEYVGSVPMGFYAIFMTWGAKLTVKIDEGEISVRSEASFPLEWLDLGQHRDNIQKFIRKLEDALGGD